LHILHLAAPCRNVPVTFTLELTMAVPRHFWPKPLQRFVSAFAVWEVLWALVAWWAFYRSPLHAFLYWAAAAAIFACVYAVGGETRMDSIFRRLPWWRD